MACKSYTLYITTMEPDLNSLLAFVKTHEGFESAQIDSNAVWATVRTIWVDSPDTSRWERIGSTMKEVRETLGY